MTDEEWDDRTSRTPLSFCYRCGERMDAATAVENGTKPSPGAFSICAYCGAILVFDAELRLRRATFDELEQLRKESPTTAEIVSRSASFFRTRGSPLSERLRRENPLARARKGEA